MKRAEFLTILFAAVLLSFAAGWTTGQWTAGDTYTIVAEYRTPEPVPTAKPSEDPDPIFPININTSSAEELMQLPSIGETRAQSIVEHRELRGKFLDIADIMEVSGIGQSIFEQIQGLITVGSP